MHTVRKTINLPPRGHRAETLTFIHQLYVKLMIEEKEKASAIAIQKTSELIWQDAQHQVLFDLIKKMDADPFDPSILVKLEQYADQHFSLEELYMKELNYPHAKEHVLAHAQFRKELSDMRKIEPALYEQLRSSLSKFLYEWLKRHVLGIDKKLEAYVLQSSQK